MWLCTIDQEFLIEVDYTACILVPTVPLNAKLWLDDNKNDLSESSPARGDGWKASVFKTGSRLETISIIMDLHSNEAAGLHVLIGLLQRSPLLMPVVHSLS